MRFFSRSSRHLGIALALFASILSIGCGGSGTPVALDPAEPAEERIDSLTAEEISNSIVAGLSEATRLLQTGAIKIRISKVEEIAKLFCAKKSLAPCKRSFEEALQIAFLRQRAADYFAKQGMYERTAIKKVWLHSSRKSKGVIDYYRKQYAGQFDQSLNEIQLIVSREFPVLALGHSSSAAGIYLSPPPTLQTFRATDLTIDAMVIPGMKAGLPPYLRLEVSVEADNLDLLHKLVVKRFFGSENVLFVAEEYYVNGGRAFESVVTHELRHYLDRRHFDTNYEIDATIVAENYKNAKRESLPEKSFAVISSRPAYKRFAERINQSLIAMQSFYRFSDGFRRSLVRDAFERIKTDYVRTFQSYYGYLRSPAEISAHREEIRYLRQTYGLSFDEILIGQFPWSAYLTLDGELMNFKTPSFNEEQKKLITSDLLPDFIYEFYLEAYRS